MAVRTKWTVEHACGPRGCQSPFHSWEGSPANRRVQSQLQRSDVPGTTGRSPRSNSCGSPADVRDTGSGLL